MCGILGVSKKCCCYQIAGQGYFPNYINNLHNKCRKLPRRVNIAYKNPTVRYKEFLLLKNHHLIIFNNTLIKLIKKIMIYRLNLVSFLSLKVRDSQISYRNLLKRFDLLLREKFYLFILYIYIIFFILIIRQTRIERIKKILSE